MVLPLRIRVDLDIITLKGYSTFPKSPKPETHHQMLFNVVHRTPLGGFLLLRRGTVCVFSSNTHYF